MSVRVSLSVPISLLLWWVFDARLEQAKESGGRFEVREELLRSAMVVNIWIVVEQGLFWDSKSAR